MYMMHMYYSIVHTHHIHHINRSDMYIHVYAMWVGFQMVRLRLGSGVQFPAAEGPLQPRLLPWL